VRFSAATSNFLRWATLFFNVHQVDRTWENEPHGPPLNPSRRRRIRIGHTLFFHDSAPGIETSPFRLPGPPACECRFSAMDVPRCRCRQGQKKEPPFPDLSGHLSGQAGFFPSGLLRQRQDAGSILTGCLKKHSPLWRTADQVPVSFSKEMHYEISVYWS
jgi:hypothetical protein